MKLDIKTIVEQFVDLLMPELTPYETTMYIFLLRNSYLKKNGAMYSIFFLGVIMVLDSFGFHIPEWFTPIVTTVVIGYFFIKSRSELRKIVA